MGGDDCPPPEGTVMTLVVNALDGDRELECFPLKNAAESPRKSGKRGLPANCLGVRDIA